MKYNSKNDGLQGSVYDINSRIGLEINDKDNFYQVLVILLFLNVFFDYTITPPVKIDIAPQDRLSFGKICG